MLAIVLFAFLFVIPPTRVHAYLDPGNGSYIIQLVAGGVLGIIVSVKIFYKQIAEFFKKIFHHGQ